MSLLCNSRGITPVQVILQVSLIDQSINEVNNPQWLIAFTRLFYFYPCLPVCFCVSLLAGLRKMLWVDFGEILWTDWPWTRVNLLFGDFRIWTRMWCHIRFLGFCSRGKVFVVEISGKDRVLHRHGDGLLLSHMWIISRIGQIPKWDRQTTNTNLH